MTISLYIPRNKGEIKPSDKRLARAVQEEILVPLE
jgi:hypothetical protein